MTFDPLRCVGMLFRKVEDNRLLYLGTCSLFRTPTVALTAAHCIDESWPAASLSVALPTADRSHNVSSIRRHWTKDIAILTLDEVNIIESPITDHAFWSPVDNWALGEAFMAPGFPTEATGDRGSELPTMRLLTGNFQRFFMYQPSSFAMYVAGEMSVPAPSGLSGAPLLRPSAPQMLLGMVTTNYDSYTVQDQVEEIDRDGVPTRYESRRIVSYGIALMLSRVAGWLRFAIPDVAGMAPIQVPEPDLQDILLTVGELVKRGGANFRSLFPEEARLTVYLDEGPEIDEAQRQALAEYADSIHRQLAIVS